ncbi:MULTISPECIES: TrmH family RNA methyltransferase [unclassified Actinomyces]|uniref:TrmH family RNA methyltransferase n=1 Tax=unclassified Actinomyces TaxID=2609248 RepID=UPI001373B10A|nr:MULTISPECIES: TrmH family RNA methyltransferase [unclassified Actinomyces]NDR54685.1 NshR/TsnR family 23S rRNA methyltransferase [Actinomyces sp. 565]QHO90957.1 NshR/TsnR family 23S rRNA methyltransferase [Actinomyces sp. 432]
MAGKTAEDGYGDNPGERALTDRSAPAAQRIADLAKVAGRPSKSVLVEDLEPLLNAMRAGLRFSEVYVLDSVRPPRELVAECGRRRVPVTVMAAGLATELFRSDKRPEIFGVARVPAPVEPEQLLEADGDLLILDGVRIVGNIGAIARSAYAFGAAGIVLVGSGLASIADRRLIRASRGYVFSVPVALMDWPQVQALIADFTRAGGHVAAVDAGATGSLDRLSAWEGRLALILGAETTGLTPQARALAQAAVSIPMNPAVESLNVSVAAGVLLHRRAWRNLAPTAQ